MARHEYGIPAVLTQAAAARRLGVSRQRVHQLVRTGVLGTVHLDGREYVSGRSVELYLRWRDERGGER